MLIVLLDDQAHSDSLFHRWIDALVDHGEATDAGWRLEGLGVAFTNYGHGDPGEITTQVMLGIAQDVRNGIVKIVQPETAKQDKGKLTAIGRSEDGGLFLLRQGWLKRNAILDEVRQRFSEFSGLAAVPVTAGGVLSKRNWYVVADLEDRPVKIVEATAAFARACALARSKTGRTGMPNEVEKPEYRYGLDEKGRISMVETKATCKEVEALHGYVWEALQREMGAELTKPTKGGYEVDGLIEGSKLLIEIKTGVRPRKYMEGLDS